MATYEFKISKTYGFKKDFNGRYHSNNRQPTFIVVPKGQEDNPDYGLDQINPNDILTGRAFYFWHNLYIPHDTPHAEYAKESGLPSDIAYMIVCTPEKLTAEYVDNIPNMELRRAAIEAMGIDRYMELSKFEILDQDKDNFNRERMLVKKQLPDDETVVGVFVKNSTPNGHYEKVQTKLKAVNSFPEYARQRIISEYRDTDDLVNKDGELYIRQHIESGKFIPEKDEQGNLVYKTYFLQVHPQLRPLMATGTYDENGDPVMKLGNPQKMTCHNAVASTFGLTGEEYQVDVES